MPPSEPPNLAASMSSLDITAPAQGSGSARGRDKDYQYASDTGPVGGESGGLVQSARIDTQNPYLDLSNLTLPNNPAEAYQLCRMLIQTFPIHQAYVHKMSTMAVTDPNITAADAPSDAVDAIVSNEKGAIDPYVNFLRNKIGLKDVALQAAYNNFGFSVAVVLLSLPFDKWFTCKNCEHEFMLSEEVDYQVGVGSPDFAAKCPRCGSFGHGRTVDKPNREDINRCSLVTLAAENVQITRNPLTGRRKVYYRIPDTDLEDFRSDRVPRDEYLDYSQEYLRAVHHSRMGVDVTPHVWVKLNPEYVYVITAPSYYLDRQGLPFPRIAATFKDTWLVRKLQKSQESIADAHLVPLEILFPDAGTLRSGDMWAYADMPSYMSKLTDAVSQHGRDKNMKAVMPFPVGHHKIGGDGKAMLLAGELRVLYEVISAGMNCPIELVFGGLCLTGDALVPTEGGLLRLDELVGDRKVTDVRDTYTVTHRGVRTEVLLSHRLGQKQKWQLETRSGHRLSGAGTHPVLVLRPDMSTEFVQMEDIQVGDQVGIQLGAELWPNETPVLSSGTPINPSFMRMLGYMVSEGYCHEKMARWNFSNCDVEVIEDFADCVEELYGYRPNTQPDKYQKNPDNPRHTIYLRKIIAQDLKEAGCFGNSLQKELPWVVRKSPRHLVAEFLAAYFEGDGAAPTPGRKALISASSRSRALLQEMQLLFTNAGIPSRISLNPDSCGADRWILYMCSESTSLYEDWVGFVSSRKSHALANRSASEGFRMRHDKIPYLKEAITEALAKISEGSGWTSSSTQLPPEWPDLCTYAQAAEFMGRTISSISLYVRIGKLSALPGGVDAQSGRFLPRMIRREALQAYLSEHGLKSRSRGRLPWYYYEVRYDQLGSTEIEQIRELDEDLAGRVEEIVEDGLWWDEVTELVKTDETVEMYDLTVDHDVHSYVANGIAVHNSFSGSSISVKLLKLDLEFIREHIERMWQWAADLISAHMGRPRVNVRISDLHLGDDLARLQFQASLVDADKLSLEHFHDEYGVDHENEIDRIKDTQKLRAEIDKIRFTAQSEAQNEGFQQQTIQQQVAPLRAMLEQLSELKDVREILASDEELAQLAQSSPEFAPLISSAAVISDETSEIQQPTMVEPVDYALADQMAAASHEYQDTFDPAEVASLIARQIADEPESWQQAISETEDQYGPEVVHELARILNEGQAMANSAQPTERPGVRGPMMST